MLFSFCVIPKRFLHDLLANHKDAQAAVNQPSEQIASSGFHCHIEDLVVVGPFLPEMEIALPLLISSAKVSFSEPLSSFVITCLSHADGRGPPAFSIS